MLKLDLGGLGSTTKKGEIACKHVLEISVKKATMKIYD